MLVSAVQDCLGARLQTIEGLRVSAYLADSASPPAAAVAVESIDYDFTMARGSDRGTFLVHILVGKASDRAARSNLDAYIDATGTKSVKRAIELDPTLGGAAETTRVMGVTVEPMNIGDVAYLAATFTVDVIA